MAFFRNSAVNLLNLHYGIHSVTLYGGGAFFSIYLLKVGIPVSGVLVSLALILLGRFVIRPVVIGMAARWGLRAMLVGGTLLSALQYPFLAEIQGVGLVLAALIAVSAVGDTFYWTTYHAYFAALGDDEFRGHQIGCAKPSPPSPALRARYSPVGCSSPSGRAWRSALHRPSPRSRPCRSSRRHRLLWRGMCRGRSKPRYLAFCCLWPMGGSLWVIGSCGRSRCSFRSA